eukprot:TRINITY_DN12846_c0_g1_i1.p1 TRINITY_DN12846_c0_g1~~TRINITY_DN12846_c0_g1_i1.p1  ORF type:complete len:335 (+),score=44.25 TRINITY_DN12846_c0_g1_i1:82-1086(+)
MEHTIMAMASISFPLSMSEDTTNSSSSSNHPTEGLSDWEVRLIFFLFGSLGMASSLFIILTYRRFHHAQKKGNSFVFYLSCCDFLFSLKFFVTACLVGYMNQFQEEDAPPGYKSYCFWLGAFHHFMGLATTGWNMMISVRLGMSFLHLQDRAPSSLSTRFYHAYVWGFASIDTIVLIFFNAYGPSYNGCWVVNRLPFRLLWLVPLGTYLALSACILVAIIVKMRTTRKTIYIPIQTRSKFQEDEYNFRVQLIKYTVVFIIVWSIPFTVRILETLGTKTRLGIFLGVLCNSVQTLANSIVWATSPNFVKFFRGNGLLGGEMEKSPLITSPKLFDK